MLTDFDDRSKIMEMCKCIYYKKGKHVMGKNTTQKPDLDTNNTSLKKKIFGENPIPVIVLSVISEFVFLFLLTLCKNGLNLFSLSDELKKIQDKYESINTSLDELTNLMNDFNEKYHELDKRIAVIEDRNGLYTVKIDPSEDLKNYIKETFTHSNSQYASKPSLQSITRLGSNIDTGEEIILNEMFNQPLMIIYKEDNQDIAICGEINDTNCWNGNCILNVYENSKLKSIIDAEYNNGILESYKQVFSFTTQGGTDVWSLSYRNKELNYDSGESWHYIYYDYPKLFDNKTFDQNNIISAKEFENYIKNVSILEGYYYGNISGGLYNDDTGNAQRVVYSQDGTVQMLYIGKFEDGEMTDLSGNAWYIILGYDNITYYYYNGKFQNAQRVDDKELIKISTEEITEKIKNISFNCDLTWKQEQ